MALIDQDALSTACRALYRQAGADFILPDLLRAADGAPQDRELRMATAEGVVVFAVGLDRALANRNLHASGPLPLTISIKLEREGAQERLCRRQRDELVRAFFLGAMMPLTLEPVEAGRRFRLSIQLAPRYSCGCGEIEAATDSREDLGASLGDALYQRTAHFFADANNGLAVWSIRAAQELFGDPRPAPEAFWPLASAEEDGADADLEAPVTVRGTDRSRRWRSVALAAGVAAMAFGTSVYVTGAARQSPASPSLGNPVPAPAIRSGAALPAAPAAGQTAPIPERHAAPSGPAELSRSVASPIPLPLMLGLPAPKGELAKGEAVKGEAPIVVAARKNEPVKVRVAARSATRGKASSRPTGIAAHPATRKAIATLNGVVRDIERLPQRIAAVVRPSSTH